MKKLEESPWIEDHGTANLKKKKRNFSRNEIIHLSGKLESLNLFLWDTKERVEFCTFDLINYETNAVGGMVGGTQDGGAVLIAYADGVRSKASLAQLMDFVLGTPFRDLHAHAADNFAPYRAYAAAVVT